MFYFRTLQYRTNGFVNIRTTYHMMCRSYKAVIFVWKMIMPYNTRFTNRVTRSVLEIRSPHFYVLPSQPRAAQKRSGFVFLSTDRVIRLVNGLYLINTSSMKQSDLYYFEATKMTSQTWSNFVWRIRARQVSILCELWQGMWRHFMTSK